MSRNFELLQNIGKDQDYFHPERVLTEPVPREASEPLSERMAAALEAATAPAPAPLTLPDQPLQFAMENSQLAELSKLVQRVFLMPGGEYNHTVVFTASDSGNGCSWICARVGELLASQVTGTVCLVDANLQSPTLHEQFGVPNHHGLADALRKSGSIRGYVSQLSRRNLALVSCGSDLGEGRNLVTSDRMRARMLELRSEFDYVLIDCPAVGESNEAVSLGTIADGVILVLKANSTRKDRARSAVNELQTSKVKILGAVLNQRTFPIPDSIYSKL